MNYLQYKSSEMFSSTQLIRKSKLIFDKIESHEIEKAVILRDGKPSFIMLDFEIYELLMNDYQKLKTVESNLHKDFNELNKTEDLEISPIKESKTKSESTDKKKSDKVENKKSALLDKLDSIDGIIINDTDEKPENLKEFWE